MSAEQATQSEKPEGVKDKLCRTCVDFKTWMKRQKSANKELGAAEIAKEKTTDGGETVAAAVETDMANLPADCPLDKDTLGRNSWSFLHTMAAYYPDVPSRQQQTDMSSFLSLFAQFYPCDYCRTDLQKDIGVSPPDVSSRTHLSAWMCQEHNRVNRKLGKSEFDCSLVDKRWRDGWDDGRCG